MGYEQERSHSAIKRCTCKSEYQDKLYGRGKRVHNKTTKHPSNAGGWRCTICGDVKAA